MGVTAYPVRDKFQFARMGTVVNLHGPIKWMSKHTFSPFNKYANFAPPVFFPSAPGMIIIGKYIMSEHVVLYVQCIFVFRERVQHEIGSTTRPPTYIYRHEHPQETCTYVHIHTRILTYERTYYTAWSVLSGTFTFLLCTLIYLCRLKPRLIKKYLKAD